MKLKISGVVRGEWNAAHRYSLQLQRDGMTAFVWQWTDADGKAMTSYSVSRGREYVTGGLARTTDEARETAMSFFPPAPERPK